MAGIRLLPEEPEQLLSNRPEWRGRIVWLSTTIDLLLRTHGGSRASMEALSTTISARPTPLMLSPSPTFESLQIIVLIMKSQMLMEDSQCLVYKAIGMLLLNLMSSQISGSMVMPAKFVNDANELHYQKMEEII